MTTKGKLKERFKSLPNDFTFDKLIRLFASVGFTLSNKGGTSGSRVAFTNGEDTFTMHKPHPDSVVKKGTLKAIQDYIESKGLLE